MATKKPATPVPAPASAVKKIKKTPAPEKSIPAKTRPVPQPVAEELPKPPLPEVEEEVPPLPLPTRSTAGRAEEAEGLSDDTKEKLLSFIEDLIDTLTFKRIGLIALLVVIGLAIFSFYENRNAIVERLTHNETIEAPVITSWTLSERSKGQMQSLVKNTNAIFISITDVDLKKNRRVIKYYYLDPTANLNLTEAGTRALALPQAVFDYDAKNTAQMVSVLSNEFRCDPYKDTINFRFMPELADKIPTVCRIAIPPFVGQFVGILTVGINPPPGGGEISKQEIDSIRLELSRIAVDIYLNDVIKKPADGTLPALTIHHPSPTESTS